MPKVKFERKHLTSSERKAVIEKIGSRHKDRPIEPTLHSTMLICSPEYRELSTSEQKEVICEIMRKRKENGIS